MVILKDVVVVHRIEDLPDPYVPSAKVKCVRCGSECWISESLNRSLKSKEKEIVCLRCFRLWLGDISRHPAEAERRG